MAEEAEEEGSPQQAVLSKALMQYRVRRIQRYSTVNVLLLTWIDEDIGLMSEINELEHVFVKDFNFFVWRYGIPSESSQVELQVQITQFIKLWGSSDDALIIVFYSGHGGPTHDKTSSECIWSARLSGGPELDWSVIQPLLITAACDVVIILDCCFAGQAVRSRIKHNVEFLAATDKDQFTPDGKDPNLPSFTKIFTDQISRMLKEEGLVTIPGLVRRMVPKETGIIKQPFYVPLSPDSTTGAIRLTRWEPREHLETLAPTIIPTIGGSSPAAVFLRLSLFTPFDINARKVLQKWMTRNSPSIIQDIAIIEQAVNEAKVAKELGNDILLSQPKPSTTSLLCWLPKRARDEAALLLSSLEAALSPPTSQQFEALDATKIVQNLSNHSAALIIFLQDNLASFNASSLAHLQSGVRNSTKDLSSRIRMRLSLIREDTPVDVTVVNFEDRAQSRQHLRVGTRGGAPVLVEYWYYSDALDSHHASEDFKKSSRHAARICALLKEEKSADFRILSGLGYVHETLHEPRLGFVYQIPMQRPAYNPSTLLQLIGSVKIVPLDVRTRLASSLCEAVLSFHSIGWFHKAIKSAKVIIFRNSLQNDQESNSYELYDFGHPYMIGFDCSRPAEAETWSATHDTPAERIYRHPERWAGQTRFERYHDLYALGVLLIEIGCWKTLPGLDPKRKCFEEIRKPERLREYLLNQVLKRLEHAAGTGYAQAARYCIQKRDWRQHEEWEVQNMIRQHVLRPLLKRC
ncbi:hypothetical protein K469DRAFT_708655 [Zopfia rhizophila CBS 207.26]|uniref:Protein kinase domain-containing protein n=1 Tax=Zopfia rhizophila CBS 207.26 TaxID=1314779 RepID=A0A6A6E0Y7_9PEZI|nr:hypothetical protein K469DRAFT_708655 [Zopfia rhizophila CBS 207.26]